MAAVPSPCSSQLSTNQSPAPKQEQPPEDASSAIMGHVGVKIEPTVDSKEPPLTVGSKEAILTVESKEEITMVESTEAVAVVGTGEVKNTSEEEDDPIDFMDTKEHIEKFKRYEAQFKQYLMSKYFSDKTILGGNIADVKMTIDGHTITASRFPPYQSYLDPANFNELLSKEQSGSLAETLTTSTSDGKPSN